ncbi:hypothetical protein [Dehalogenimonas etheniformans]|uniref:Uncharacterized protein n=1 Tax=Dehalogenimonas etheniformans TaxID=1536648 RepID=A0A2P5PAB0_9CHLR|nr:hypothetical protein [Dehalogenimonas etheniformans]PPD59220.1 hypothetical protein JP09_000655 [Dehalogenimonas etheniformans]QNT75738.1 hypothetical protein HX448_03060 [Dehalogenimonas etheniformans]
MQMLLFLIIILLILFVLPFHGKIGGFSKWLFNTKSIWGVFWALVAISAVSMLGFVPGINELFFGPIYALLFVSFIVLGITLVLLPWRSDMQGWLRTSLILTGASPAAVVVIFIVGSALDEATNWGGELGNIVIYALFALFIFSAITTIYLRHKTSHHA